MVFMFKSAQFTAVIIIVIVFIIVYDDTKVCSVI